VATVCSPSSRALSTPSERPSPRNSRSPPTRGRRTVRVRIGLHTGEPTLVGSNYVGLDVHRAARLSDAGHGGQMLLSATTRELVEHQVPEGVVLRDLGEHRLRDLQRLERISQAEIAGLPLDFTPPQTMTRGPNNLPIARDEIIGREDELATAQRPHGREEMGWG
jgi:class 3 adenylate cyclase